MKTELEEARAVLERYTADQPLVVPPSIYAWLMVDERFKDLRDRVRKANLLR